MPLGRAFQTKPDFGKAYPCASRGGLVECQVLLARAICARISASASFGSMCAAASVSVEVKVAVAIQKRGHLLFSEDGTPAVESPLAGQCKVQTQIGFGMASRVGSYLGKP